MKATKPEPKAERKSKGLKSASPEALLQQFEQAISQCQGFTRTEIDDTGFDAWRYDGMHDPPKAGVRHSKVLRRVNFECGFSQNGFVVQVDLLDVPDQGLQAAVFVRSKDYPKRKNTGNATFKFRWDAGAEAYVVDVHDKAVVRALQSPGGLPPYITPVLSRAGRMAVGKAVDSTLAHNLILAADFAAQIAAKSNRVRTPASFYAPMERATAPRSR